MSADDLRAVLLDYYRLYVQRGDAPALHVTGGAVLKRGAVSIWITAGGHLFPDRDSSKGIRVKSGRMGVIAYLPDGTSKYEIIELARVWREIIDPPPKQLSLWEEV